MMPGGRIGETGKKAEGGRRKRKGRRGRKGGDRIEDFFFFPSFLFWMFASL